MPHKHTRLTRKGQEIVTETKSEKHVLYSLKNNKDFEFDPDNAKQVNKAEKIYVRGKGSYLEIPKHSYIATVKISSSKRKLSKVM